MRLNQTEAKEYRWQLVVKLSESGKTQTEISEIVQLSQSSISIILKRHKAGEKLVVKINKGSARKLNTEQEERLTVILDKGAVSQGFETEGWTAGRVGLVVKEEFGVVYSERGMRKVLKRLGYTKQRFQLKDHRQPDLEPWRNEQLPEIKKMQVKNLE